MPRPLMPQLTSRPHTAAGIWRGSAARSAATMGPRSDPAVATCCLAIESSPKTSAKLLLARNAVVTWADRRRSRDYLQHHQPLYLRGEQPVRVVPRPKGGRARRPSYCREMTRLRGCSWRRIQPSCGGLHPQRMGATAQARSGRRSRQITLSAKDAAAQNRTLVERSTEADPQALGSLGCRRESNSQRSDRGPAGHEK